VQCEMDGPERRVEAYESVSLRCTVVECISSIEDNLLLWNTAPHQQQLTHELIELQVSSLHRLIRPVHYCVRTAGSR
jgi:hypothetical protein